MINEPQLDLENKYNNFLGTIENKFPGQTDFFMCGICDQVAGVVLDKENLTLSLELNIQDPTLFYCVSRYLGLDTSKAIGNKYNMHDVIEAMKSSEYTRISKISTGGMMVASLRIIAFHKAEEKLKRLQQKEDREDDEVEEDDEENDAELKLPTLKDYQTFLKKINPPSTNEKFKRPFTAARLTEDEYDAKRDERRLAYCTAYIFLRGVVNYDGDHYIAISPTDSIFWLDNLESIQKGYMKDNFNQKNASDVRNFIKNENGQLLLPISQEMISQMQLY